MLNDKPPPSRMPSFSNPFRRLSKTSRRASKEDASKIGPTNTASSSQTQPHSQTKTEILTPGPTASLLTALHTSILATPPSARLEYIETLQKLLHTISLCPELTTTIIPKSEYESDALIPCSIFQDRALEYIAEGAKRDRLTVVFVREEGCEFCKVVEAASGVISEGERRVRKGPLSKAECLLIEEWRNNRICWCSGEEREKEHETGDRPAEMNGQSSERRQEQQLPECLHTSTLPIAQQAPSTSTSTSTSPEQDLTAEQKIEQEIQQREQLKRRDAELRLLVPEIRRPEPYGWDQDPGLDGYNATQEREEYVLDLMLKLELSNSKKNANTNETSDFDVDSGEGVEERRRRGRSQTRRERTGYGVPYNRMNGTALNTSHQPTWSDFRERRTGYGVPYKQNKTTNRGNETVPYTSHYNGSNGDNNDDNETTPHPARSPSRDVYGTPYSTRPHTPSHESRPSDPLSRPRERESCTSSSSSSAYTIPLNGRRSTPPYTTSTNKLKPPLTLSSTGTSSRSTSSYIAPRHQGIRTPSYSSSYYSNFPAAASKPGSARCSTSARTSAARRRKGS